MKYFWSAVVDNGPVLWYNSTIMEITKKWSREK